MPANPFDQFDAATSSQGKTSEGSNPFDAFDDGGEPPKARPFFEQLGSNIAAGFDQSIAGHLSRTIDPTQTGLTGDELGVTAPNPMNVAARKRRELNEVGNKGDVAASQGILGKAGTYATQFGGQLVGSAPSPESWLGGGAKTILGAAAKNAAINAGVDVGLQGLGVAAGIQDKYSPGQTGMAAGIGGVFGGVEHVATPFVADLFKKRGSDTTPKGDPRQPQPEAQPQPTPTFEERHADTFKSGTAEDIRAAFREDGRAVPKAEDVEKWVAERDAATDTRAAAEAHIAETTKDWKNAPEFEVLNDVADIADPEVRKYATEQGAEDPSALGFLGPDGKVRIFANRIESPEQMNSVIFHEALGHFGLSQKFGERLDATLQTLMDRNVGQFGKQIDEWLAKNPDAYGGNRVRAAEEVLAEMSEGGVIPQSLADAFAKMVRDFARQMGMKIPVSDAEIRTILSMAHSATVNGLGRDVAANGFRSSADDMAKFMFAGRKATPFKEGAWDIVESGLDNGADPRVMRINTGYFKGEDGKPRIEISDKDATMLVHDIRVGDRYHLDNLIDHPELFDAYPELKDVQVHVVNSHGKFNGGYAPNTNTIMISHNAPAVKKTLLHEIQHVVQGIEGHSSGTSPEAVGKDAYRRAYGEIEARSTSARSDLEGWQRRMTDPYESQGIRPKDMIVNEPLDMAAERNSMAWEDSEQLSPAQQEFIANKHPIVPDIVYHGRNRDYDTIDVDAPRSGDWDSEGTGDTGWFGHGFYMSSSPKVAGNAWAKGEGANVLPLIADIRNPFIIEVPEHSSGATDMAKALTKAGAPPSILKSPKAQTKWLKSQGYDGVVAKGPHIADEIVAFSPQQIKSVFNRDPNSSDLKFMHHRKTAAEPGYVADDLEGIYKALDENYVPTVKTWNETKQEALSIGFKPSQIKDLKERDPGELAVRLHRIQAAANMADMKIAELNKKLDTPQWSVADQHAYIQALADRNYLVTRARGERAEAGRALNIAKAASSYSNKTMADIAERMKEAGADGLVDLAEDPIKFLRLAQQIKAAMAAGNNGAVQNLMNGVNSPYWWQYLLSYRQNMMLSGLSTHAKAAIDMATSIGKELEEGIVTMPIGAVRNGLKAMGVPLKEYGYHPTEYAMRLWGLTRAALEASTYKNAADTLIHGGVSRYGVAKDARIPVVSKVGDALAASDQFFRAFLMNANMYSLGARRAYKELKTAGSKVDWNDVYALGASYAQTPSTGMRKEALDLTENTMLINKSPLNSAIDNAKLIRPNMTAMEQAGAFFANLLTPFIRTSSNGLMNQILRRSPLFWLDPVSIADLKAGGARADIAVARIAYGTAILGSYWVAAGDDEKYTGAGPKNPNKLKELQAGGWSPNAQDEGDHYSKTHNLNFSLNPLDKHNATFTMVKGLREAFEAGAKEDDVMRGLKLATYSLLQNVSEQTFLGDIADGTGAAAARGPTAEGTRDRYVAGMARSFLPNVGIQTANILDPNQHDTKGMGIGASIKDNIPGLSKELPIKYNVYGQPMKTGVSPLGVRAFGMKGNRTEKTTDPTEIELQRLAKLSPAAVVTGVQRSVKIGDVTVPLTAQQVSDYQRDAGQLFVASVKERMDDGTWDGLSDKEKIDLIKKPRTGLLTVAKKSAREALLEQEGWLNAKQNAKLEEQPEDAE